MPQTHTVRISASLFLAALALAALALLLAGCDVALGGEDASQPTATPYPTNVPTPTWTPQSTSAAVVSSIAIPCVTSADAKTKTFADSETGFTFTFPATWTETQCERTVRADGVVLLRVGNLMKLYIVPRRGQMVEQWIAAQKDASETITLSPLTAKKAEAAYDLKETSTRDDPNLPFKQINVIVVGSSYFFCFVTMIDMNNETDTPLGAPYATAVPNVSVP